MSKKKNQSVRLRVLETEYLQAKGSANNLLAELTRQILVLLNKNEIQLAFPIQSRIKEWSSIEDKINRLSLNISSIYDLQDFVGLRLIMLFKRDVELTTKLLSEYLTVTRKYDTSERLKEDQFGYSSNHLLVEIPQKWQSIPSFTDSEGIKIEIQVRTMSQHVWAEISHKLQYKKESSVPISILRSVYRTSALLETVDLEFERLLNERELYRSKVEVDSDNRRLNVDLLESILDSKLPQLNKIDNEDFSELLADLNKFGIDNTEKLNELISKYLKKAILKDKKRVKSDMDLVRSGEIEENFFDDIERLKQGYFFTHTGLIRSMMEMEYGDPFNDYLYAKDKTM